MFNHQFISRCLCVIWLLFVFSLQNVVLWSLESQVASKVQAWNKPCVQLDSSFYKDPFVDAMTNVEKSSMQMKMTWIQYVKSELSQKGCWLSDSKIYVLLYNFVPEFRAEIARSLKMESWDYDSEKYVFEEETIMDYCNEYFKCAEAWQRDASDNKINSDTDENVKTNCKEFFQRSYREWQDNQWRMENLHLTQLWSDRYWNQTLEDSPYDILWDLWIEWNSLYQSSSTSLSLASQSINEFDDSNFSLNSSRMSRLPVKKSEPSLNLNANDASNWSKWFNSLNLWNLDVPTDTSKIDYIHDLLDGWLWNLGGWKVLWMNDWNTNWFTSQSLQSSYWLNDLDEDINAYRVVGSLWNVVDNFAVATNYKFPRREETDLDNIPEPKVTLDDNSDTFRYNVFAMNFFRISFP